MKVRSPLANMDLSVGAIGRRGNDLILSSGADSSMDATIIVSAREVVSVLWKMLSSRGGLVFTLGLPVFWLRQTLGVGAAPAGAHDAPAQANINKPW